VESTLAHLGRVGEQVHKVRMRWEEAERTFNEPPPRPDRDMDDVAPEVNEARKDLKQAIKEAARNRDPASQQRLAGILRRAAEEIRRHEGERRVDIEIDI
jgi:ribosome-binding protein aMBF1 (putative translation factor)